MIREGVKAKMMRYISLVQKFIWDHTVNLWQYLGVSQRCSDEESYKVGYNNGYIEGYSKGFEDGVWGKKIYPVNYSGSNYCQSKRIFH